ncbi:MAG: long-chain fatty acid--CoA ligase [Acidimicrobiales bacterium]
MRGLMQDFPLTLPHLHVRAERLFADKEVVTVTAAGKHTVSYGDWAERTRRLGGALDTLGISADGRVATFGWNTARHLELYFAAPCTNRVLHALNIRLFPEQLVYVANHAEDEVVFVDKSLAKLVWPLFAKFDTVRHIVVMDDGAGEVPDAPAGKQVHDYEELLAASSPAAFDVRDENQAASMCYTSGTTGNPKGVVYSHRSTVLHTYGVLTAGGLGPTEEDRVLPVVPMFHANAWGLAHAAVACGADLIMPGPDLSPAGLAALIESERVTVAAGVPTIWMGVLPELKGRDTSSLRSIPCGGSAVPKVLSEAYKSQIGLPITQAWGMTETSPVASSGHIKTTLAAALDEDAQADLRTTVGQPLMGVEARIVDVASGDEQPWNGESSGELQVRGPWVASSYYNDERSPESFTEDGWLKTGDVATIDAHGYIQLRDRTKDVIKSGGEWISSVELENEIMAHPAVAEAAVIALPHPKWSERPLACVVLREGQTATKDDIVAFLDGRVAKWWLPDDVAFVAEIPKTSVGKFSKKDLRDQFADYVLPTAQE